MKLARQVEWARLQNFYRRRASSLVFRKTIRIEPERPIISFTFDDFPRSALLRGGEILRRFGVRGTYYASLGLLGKRSSTGEMFLAEDLSELVRQGHELGCHTYGHCDSWSTEPRDFEDSILQNRDALSRLAPGLAFRSFSYPISLPRPSTKARVSCHFSCCRAGGQMANIGSADANQLSAFFLEKSRNDFQVIQAVIERNRAVRGWLIFATHDVSEDPTSFGCTPIFFEQVVKSAIQSGAEVLPVAEALESLLARRQPKTSRVYVPSRTRMASDDVPQQPLVSILIPAYNAQQWLADTIQSALDQTWEPKEVIVVDDGSKDATLAVARRFESQGVRVIAQTNQGGAAARNTAFAASRGSYVQWLDADDLLAPDKIARQMEMLHRGAGKATAISSAFGRFRYRWHRAEFVPTELWADLSPAEWLVRKMGQNLYMQTATWLVSRELAEAAGPWDTRMLSDDDGEYFCRVLLKSNGVCFVPDAKVYYRAFRYDGLAYVGKSTRKIDALWLSMKLHIGYLRSLEDTKRTRAACVAYLQRNLIHFYPNKMGTVREAERLAEELGGKLRPPYLSWKYSWMKSLFGWTIAKNAALYLRKIRWATQKQYDRLAFVLGARTQGRSLPGLEVGIASGGPQDGHTNSGGRELLDSSARPKH